MKTNKKLFRSYRPVCRSYRDVSRRRLMAPQELVVEADDNYIGRHGPTEIRISTLTAPIMTVSRIMRAA